MTLATLSPDAVLVAPLPHPTGRGGQLVGHPPPLGL